MFDHAPHNLHKTPRADGCAGNDSAPTVVVEAGGVVVEAGRESFIVSRDSVVDLVRGGRGNDRFRRHPKLYDALGRNPELNRLGLGGRRFGPRRPRRGEVVGRGRRARHAQMIQNQHRECFFLSAAIGDRLE